MQPKSQNYTYEMKECARWYKTKRMILVYGVYCSPKFMSYSVFVLPLMCCRVRRPCNGATVIVYFVRMQGQSFYTILHEHRQLRNICVAVYHSQKNILDRAKPIMLVGEKAEHIAWCCSWITIHLSLLPRRQPWSCNKKIFFNRVLQQFLFWFNSVFCVGCHLLHLSAKQTNVKRKLSEQKNRPEWQSRPGDIGDAWEIKQAQLCVCVCVCSLSQFLCFDIHAKYAH